MTGFASAQVASRPQSYAQTVLHAFSGLYIDGAYPLASPLVRDSTGNLYGTTEEGGLYGLGSVFKLSSSGETRTLYSFSPNGDGTNPKGTLALDSHGYLYGTTGGGGADGDGTIFEIATDGSQYSIMYTFRNQNDGAYPTSGVTIDPSGNLYTATWFGGLYGSGALVQLTPAGQLNVLYSFGTNPDDGDVSLGLTRDSQGNIYGTDLLGGPYAGTNCIETSHFLQFGCGVVFKVDPNGQETLLHVFSGVAGDGGSPSGAPILDSNGNLYGTALLGGTGTCQGASFPTGGCGTIFKVDSEGNYSTLYNFPGTGQSGAGPVGQLVMDSSGNLYGLTEDGGAGDCIADPSFGGDGGYWTGYPGCGLAFKLSPSGTETILNQFIGSNGGNPEAGLITDSSGNFYGTTYDGGDLIGCGYGYGCGTVFELSPNGSLIHHSHI